MSKPKVSIIMPTYNVEKYFRECLDSVVNQTLRDIEIIPVDDGSPDNCGAIMDEYAAKDPRVKPIHQKNGGYGSAVNNGIAAATGEYIGIVETDDWCNPLMYEKMYNRAKEVDADVCKCGFNTYNSFDEIQKSRKWQCKLENIEAFPNDKAYTINELPGILNYHASIWSNIYKREFLLKNNIKVNSTQGASYQDFPFMVEVMCKASKIVVLPEYLYNWRTEPAQNSSTIRTNKKCMIMASQCGEVKKVLKKLDRYETFKEYIYSHFFRANFPFFVNIEDEYKHEYFEKLRKLFGEIKNDQKFKALYFTKENKKYLGYILNNDFDGFFKYHYKLTHHPIKDLRRKLIQIRWNRREKTVRFLGNYITGEDIHNVISVCGVKLKIRNRKKEMLQRIEKLERTVIKQQEELAVLKSR